MSIKLEQVGYENLKDIIFFGIRKFLKKKKKFLGNIIVKKEALSILGLIQVIQI